MQELRDMHLELAQIPEDEWTPLVRGYITGKVYAVVQALEPYVDGTMGPVSSKHVQNQIAALTLLGRLHRCFDAAPPQEADPDLESETRRSLQRERVREQLKALEQRAQ